MHLCTAASTWASLLRSHSPVTTLTPRDDTAPAVCASCAWSLRVVRKRFAPSLAKASAVGVPKLCRASVTKTVLPFRLVSTLSPSSLSLAYSIPLDWSAWRSGQSSQEIRSAIDQIGLTRNVAGLFAGEKDYRRGALVDGALHWNGDGLYACAFTTWDFLAWCADDFDTARANEVGGDIILAVLARNGPGQPFGRHFRRGAGGATKGGDPRVVDDTSPAVLHHTGKHRLTHQEGRVQVDAHGPEPVLRADVQQLPPRPPPGVIHHHINPAKLGQSCVHEGLDLLLVGYVTLARHHF